MNQQQFDQMQNDILAMQAQLKAATTLATQAQAAAQTAQAADIVQAALVAQQQQGLIAAQAMAAQAVADAAAAHAVDAIAGVVPVNAVPVPPAAAPPIVTVNAPGQVAGVIIFDSAGMKLHKSASAPLSALLDGKSSKLMSFINDLGTRARSFGWDQAIFNIVTVQGTKNVLDNYSSITMAEILAMANVYSGTLPTATRGSQAATQVHLMLQDSLSPELKDRVIARRAEYSFTINNFMYEDGVTMLNVVFNLVAVDTKATMAVIQRNLEYAHLADVPPPRDNSPTCGTGLPRSPPKAARNMVCNLRRLGGPPMGPAQIQLHSAPRQAKERGADEVRNGISKVCGVLHGRQRRQATCRIYTHESN
jgi:hypothetical protein